MLIYLAFLRDLQYIHVEKWNTRRMTGIKVEWYFSDGHGQKINLASKRKYSIKMNNIQFSKIINMLHTSNKTKSNSLEAIKII